MPTSRPILFSAEMVRAILDGQKTQTRRVILPTMTAPRVAPLHVEPWLDDGELVTEPNGCVLYHGTNPDYLTAHGKWFTCPYGAPGDRLYVRETWRESGAMQRGDGKIPKEHPGTGEVLYRADGEHTGPWRPGIHMPRWASRLSLRVEEVLVERVQDITREDALAEGAGDDDCCWRAVYGSRPRERFAKLWNSINGARGYGWESNCWVWVVRFSVAA